MASTDTGKAGDEPKEKRRFVARSLNDVQRIKLEKLMSNPQKEVVIPTGSTKSRKNADGLSDTPSFVRNVMGSSAGAGSGEFHVYRHLRRKEYARQKEIQHQGVKERMDDEFQDKIETNRLQAESKTAKKRAKRLKKKQRAKMNRSNATNKRANEPNESGSSSSDSNTDVDEPTPEPIGEPKSNGTKEDQNASNEPQQAQ